jgi:F-type H+-transporting ATPase subunit delta
VGSKLGSGESKVELVRTLLSGKASEQTVSILVQLVQLARGRRIGELLRFATTVVADQAGLAIATVTSARPIGQAQLDRLAKGLARQYGKGLRINQVINPAVIGGLRIQIGDDVIDGSVATRLQDLRLQLTR